MNDKSQIIRLVDVVVIAPLMVYAGVQVAPPKDWLKYSLIALGVATAVYNGHNYWKNRKTLGYV